MSDGVNVSVKEESIISSISDGHGREQDSGSEIDWGIAPRRGKNRIIINKKVSLRWGASSELAERHTEIDVGVNTVDGKSCLAITTGAAAKWTRLIVNLGKHHTAVSIYVDIVLQLDSLDESDDDWVEPFIVRHSGNDQALPLGNVRKRIPIKTGKWFTLRGLFMAPAQAQESLYEFYLQLPNRRKLRVCGLNVSLIEDERGFADKTEVLLPFTAEMLSESTAVLPADLKDARTGILDDVRRRLGELPENPPDAFVKLLTDGPSEANLELMRAGLYWAGVTSLSSSTSADHLLKPASPFVVALVRARFAAHSASDLSSADREALRLLLVHDDAGIALRFGAPRPLVVKHSGIGTSDGDIKFWDSIYSTGVAEKWEEESDSGYCLLEIMPAAHLSALALLILRTSEATARGLQISAYRQTTVHPRWSDKIIGYPREKEAVAVGSLRDADGNMPSGAAIAIAVLEDKRVNRGIHAPTKDAVYAYLVVPPEFDGDLDTYDNVENCTIFKSVEDAAKSLSNPTERDLTKPVIFFHSLYRGKSDYITSTVARHWSYAGKYALTPFTFSYQSDNSEIHWSWHDTDFISRFALTASIVSMPLSEFLKLDINSKIFFPTIDICVSYADRRLPSDELDSFGKRRMTSRLTIDEMEALSCRGCIDTRFVDLIDMNVHWPIDRILRSFRKSGWRLSELIERGMGKPTTEIVDRIFDALRETDPDWETIEQLQPLVRKISRHPELCLAIKPSSLLTLIAIARRGSAADEIASNLSTFADEICLHDVALIFPLIELLASCLAPTELSVVLSYCAARHIGASDRYLLRIADCVRRYGDVALLATLLMSILHRSRDKLRKSDLARRFEPVLRSHLSAIVEERLGAELVNLIRMTAETADRIDRAVREEDRDGVMRLLASPSAMAQVDFTRWLDRLRCLSNELRNMQIPVSGIALPGIHRQPRQVLAATIFSDVELIRRLMSAGVLQQANHINAAARNVAGDNAMANAIIASPFAQVAINPLKIVGETIDEVFDNAAKSISSSPSTSDAKVTVIMSAFNPDIPLMEKAVDSVLNQSHRNVELIIVDDASTLALAESIQEIGSRSDRCKVIRLDQNLGPYMGRNIAIAESTGDFVAIQDADDWAHPDRLKLQVAQLEESKHIRLATCYHIRIDRAGKIQFEADFSMFGDGTMTSIFRRELFEEIGVFLKVRSRGDVEMRERVRAYYGKHAIAKLPVPLLLCLGDSGTLSQRTLSNNAEHLQLFRSNISRRKGLDGLRRANAGISKERQLLVPHQIRAPIDAGVNE